MSWVVVEPNSTTSLGDATVTGAANAHTALSDDSDTSYVDLTGPSPLILGLPNPSIPAGGTVLLIRATLRGHHNAIPATLFTTISGSGLGASSVSDTTTVHWLTAKGFSGLDAAISTAPTGLSLHLATTDDGAIRIYEADVAVDYLAQPAVTVGQPTGTITTTNLPEVAWLLDLDSPAGRAALPMAAYEVKVFNDAAYGAGGFDPDTSDPTTESGVKAAGIVTQTVLGPAATWQVEEPLPNDTYKAYVRVAQTVNGSQVWSDWDDGPAFTIDADLPHTPSIHAVGDGANARNAIAVSEGDDGDVASHYIIVERSTDGGETFEPIRTEVGGGAVLPSDYY